MRKEMPKSRVALLLRLRRGLKEQLMEFAKREHRSLNQQIEFILERFLSDTSNKEGNEPPSGPRRKSSAGG
jgi:hypothetical protein